MTSPRPAPGAPARVQVVIVSYQASAPLLTCLDSLVRHVQLPIEITVVDNASGDGSVEAVRARHPRVQLLLNESNQGFASASNRGWRAGRAGLVLFLNPDAEVTAGAVETLAGRLEARPEIAIVGPLTRNADGSVQVSTGPDLTPWTELGQRRLVRGVSLRRSWALAEAERRHAHEHEPAWVSGACLMTRREALLAAGGFDEGFFLYEEDADLCRRVRRGGGRILFTPAAEIRHHRGASVAQGPSAARLAYHASHLRYYRNHNSLAAQVMLRLGIAGRGLLGWPRAGAGRAEGKALLRLALHG